MKTTHAIASFAALFSLVASSNAQAATGAFDGEYDLHYGLMNMGVQCGYAAPGGYVAFNYEHYLLDLSQDERLPVDAFDGFLAQRLEQIEAAELGPYQEQLARANATAFFTGLRLSLDAMIQGYPDLLRVDFDESAAQPTPFTYAFEGQMIDRNTGVSMNIPGVMNYMNGAFTVMPGYVYGYQVDSASVFRGLAAGVQLGGAIERGIGGLSWQAEKLNYDEFTGELWGCGISNLAGFEITAQGEEPTMAPVAPTAYKLQAGAAKSMKSKVHSDAVQNLKREVKMNSRIGKEASILGRTLAR